MLVAVLTIGSTVLGFLRDVVIGAVFGAGPSLDAYLVAQGVMNIVLGLISGAMARSITPSSRANRRLAQRRVPAPGFGPEQTELAVLLTRVVLIATVLVSGTNLLAGVGHAHGRFGWAGA